MTALIALIGGNEFHPDCEAMDRALLARLAAGPKIVVLPTAAAHENPRLAADNGVRYFRRLGAQAGAAMIVDTKTASQPSLVKQIGTADLVTALPTSLRAFFAKQSPAQSAMCAHGG